MAKSHASPSQKHPSSSLTSSSPNLAKKANKPITTSPATLSHPMTPASHNVLPSPVPQSACQSQAPVSSESVAISSKKLPSIKPDQISLALKTLIDYSNKTMKKKLADGELFADDVGTNDCFVNLVISLKRIANRERHKPVRINLTHSLLDPRVSPVCLIVKDPQREYKDLLEEKKIKFISKVVGIAKLRGKHSSFEARRLLLSSHTIFLADERVLPMLPNILGSKFFQSKKLPLPVSLTDPRKLKAELEKTISSTYLRLGTGSCVNIKIGDLSRHNETQLKDNLIQVLEQLGKKIPMGGWTNIQGIHIKTGTSISLPIWLSELNSEDFGRFNLTPTPAEQERIKASEQKKKASLDARSQAKISKKRRIDQVLTPTELSDTTMVSDAKAETKDLSVQKKGTKSKESHTAPPQNKSSGADPQPEVPTSRPKKRKQKEQASEPSEPPAPEPAANLPIETSEVAEFASKPEQTSKKDWLKTKTASKNQPLLDGAAKYEAKLDTNSIPSSSSTPAQPSSTPGTQAVDTLKLAPTPDTTQTSLPGKAKKHKKDKPQSNQKPAQEATRLADEEASSNPNIKPVDAPKPVSTPDTAHTPVSGKAKKHKKDKPQSDPKAAQQVTPLAEEEAGSNANIQAVDAPKPVSNPDTAQTPLSGKAKKHKKDKPQSDSKAVQQATPLADEKSGSKTDISPVNVTNSTNKVPDATNTLVTSKSKKNKKDKSKSDHEPNKKAKKSVDPEVSSKTGMKAVDGPQPVGSQAANTPSPGQMKKSKDKKPDVMQKQPKGAVDKEVSLKKDKSSKKSGEKDEHHSKGKPRSSVGEKARGVGKFKVDGTVSKKG